MWTNFNYYLALSLILLITYLTEANRSSNQSNVQSSESATNLTHLETTSSTTITATTEMPNRAQNVIQSNTTVDRNANDRQTLKSKINEGTVYQISTQEVITQVPEDYSDDSDDTTFNMLWVLAFVIPISLVIIIIKVYKSYKRKTTHVAQSQLNCGTVIDTTGFHDISLHSEQSIASNDSIPQQASYVFSTQSAHNYWPSHINCSADPQCGEDMPPSYQTITAKH